MFNSLVWNLTFALWIQRFPLDDWAFPQAVITRTPMVHVVLCGTGLIQYFHSRIWSNLHFRSLVVHLPDNYYFFYFGNLPSQPAIIRVHIYFQAAQMYSVPWIFGTGLCKGWLKDTWSSWKKLVMQDVRLVGCSEIYTPSFAVSSSGTIVAGMCPEQARLPGLVVVLPVWIVYTGGADWELKFTFHSVFAWHCNKWSPFSTNSNDMCVLAIYFSPSED